MGIKYKLYKKLKLILLCLLRYLELCLQFQFIYLNYEKNRSGRIIFYHIQ